MLAIGPKQQAQTIPDQTRRVTPASAPAKSAIKTGTIIVLSPTALKLSRTLSAIQVDPNKEPAERLDAAGKLRQLAMAVFTAE